MPQYAEIPEVLRPSCGLLHANEVVEARKRRRSLTEPVVDPSRPDLVERAFLTGATTSLLTIMIYLVMMVNTAPGALAAGSVP